MAKQSLVFSRMIFPFMFNICVPRGFDKSITISGFRQHIFSVFFAEQGADLLLLPQRGSFRWERHPAANSLRVSVYRRQGIELFVGVVMKMTFCLLGKKQSWRSRLRQSSLWLRRLKRHSHNFAKKGAAAGRCSLNTNAPFPVPRHKKPRTRMIRGFNYSICFTSRFPVRK